VALALKNLLFTVLVPGTVAVYVPLLIAQERSAAGGSTLALAVAVLVVGTGFQLFILLYEEPHLLREFGSQYEAYRSSVSRWLPTPRPGPDA
jgi:protein-S-isoprenylcysteine O-methyltransferase Ste14